MAGTATELARLLNAVMAQVKKLDDDQAAALADGAGELRYIPKPLLKQFTAFSRLSDAELEQIATGDAEYKLVAKTLKPQFRKLEKLSEEQLVQLANDEAEFKFVSKIPRATRSAAAKVPPPTAAEVYQAMLAAPDQAAAHAFFEKHKLKAADLKRIAAELDVPTAKTGPAIVEALIKVFVTGRLTTSAVRF